MKQKPRWRRLHGAPSILDSWGVLPPPPPVPLATPTSVVLLYPQPTDTQHRQHAAQPDSKTPRQCHVRFDLFIFFVFVLSFHSFQAKSHFSAAWSVVCLSVVCHTCAPCLNRSTDLDVIWQVRLRCPVTHCVRWRSLTPKRKGRFTGLKPQVKKCTTIYQEQHRSAISPLI